MITRLEAEFDDSPLCIGQSLSAQHAMRASGVAAHPAHSATLPATSANTATKADARLNQVTTALKDAEYAAKCQTGGDSQDCVRDLNLISRATRAPVCGRGSLSPVDGK